MDVGVIVRVEAKEAIDETDPVRLKEQLQKTEAYGNKSNLICTIRLL